MTVPSSSFSHRSTLKQSNKAFKSKYASKGELKGKVKGKINKKQAPGKGGQGGTLSKADRKNAAKLHQAAKNVHLETSARIFNGSENGTPKIMAIIPLCPDVDPNAVVDSFHRAVGGGESVMDDALLVQSEFGTCTLKLERFKQRLQFIPLARKVMDILDAVKVADYICFVVSAVEEVDAFGSHILSCIKAQGIPSIIHSIQHFEVVPVKQQPEVRKSLSSYMQYHFPDEPKMFATSSGTEALTILRHITSHLPKNVTWREKLSYCLTEQAEFVDTPASETGTLKVTGYIRGNPLSPNRLLHLPDFGDFQIESIQVHSTRRDRVSMDVVDSMLYPHPELQDSLVSENEVDEMAAEQTWPTLEELMDADPRGQGSSVADSNVSKLKRKVPKGTSAYQAAWIVDDDAEASEGETSETENDIPMTDDTHWNSLGLGNGPTAAISSEESSVSDYEDLVDEENDDTGTNRVSFAVDEEDTGSQDAEAYLAYMERRKASQEDMQFPDEVDTPKDIPARVRFQRYRGLKSFRTSAWDPYENLPVDYSRVFQFANFNRSRKLAFGALDSSEGAAAVGKLVTISIKNVPKSIQDVIQSGKSISIFSLLPHEHKMSLLNLNIQRVSPLEGEVQEPIKSKDPLLMICGYRRFVIYPIYSTNTRSGTNNVHKFERFLQPGRSSMASVYAPIMFTNAPALFFKYSESSHWSIENAPLLATGSVADLDVKRIIAKRIILTGHPFKVNKRGAVVRFMFFNPEDIHYFKPVELTTKMGRTGHIRDSLGTHGHMKCLFDAQLKAHDTVCMYLYKRVFPKWNTRLFSSLTGGKTSPISDNEMEEDL